MSDELRKMAYECWSACRSWDWRPGDEVALEYLLAAFELGVQKRNEEIERRIKHSSAFKEGWDAPGMEAYDGE